MRIKLNFKYQDNSKSFVLINYVSLFVAEYFSSSISFRTEFRKQVKLSIQIVLPIF